MIVDQAKLVHALRVLRAVEYIGGSGFKDGHKLPPDLEMLLHEYCHAATIAPRSRWVPLGPTVSRVIGLMTYDARKANEVDTLVVQMIIMYNADLFLKRGVQRWLDAIGVNQHFYDVDQRVRLRRAAAPELEQVAEKLLARIYRKAKRVERKEAEVSDGPIS